MTMFGHQDILARLATMQEQEQADHRTIAMALVELINMGNRSIQMTQALLDAVTTLGGSVQTLTDAMVSHDQATQSLLQKLQAALNANPATAQDPDIARAIDVISTASSAVANAAKEINAETQAMVAAVAPPAPQPTADPAPQTDPSQPAAQAAPATDGSQTAQASGTSDAAAAGTAAS